MDDNAIRQQINLAMDYWRTNVAKVNEHHQKFAENAEKLIRTYLTTTIVYDNAVHKVIEALDQQEPSPQTDELIAILLDAAYDVTDTLMKACL